MQRAPRCVRPDMIPWAGYLVTLVRHHILLH